MSIAIALITLGILMQGIILVTQIRRISCFTVGCPKCGYQIPPMERPPDFYNCPECHRLFELNDSLPSPKA